jgi:sec-independent protein translocase protein TatA
MTPPLAMFGLGVPELLIILAVVLLLFGGSRLAGLGKSTGRALKEFKEETKSLKGGETAPGQPPAQGQDPSATPYQQPPYQQQQPPYQQQPPPYQQPPPPYQQPPASGPNPADPDLRKDV